MKTEQDIYQRIENLREDRHELFLGYLDAEKTADALAISEEIRDVDIKIKELLWVLEKQ